MYNDVKLFYIVIKDVEKKLEVEIEFIFFFYYYLDIVYSISHQLTLILFLNFKL